MDTAGQCLAVGKLFCDIQYSTMREGGREKEGGRGREGRKQGACMCVCHSSFNQDRHSIRIHVCMPKAHNTSVHVVQTIHGDTPTM